MARGLLRCALALILAGSLAITASGAARNLRERPVGGTGLASLSRELSQAPDRARYSMLLVALSDAAKAAKEPGRALVYFSGTDVNTNWNAGVTYRQASARGWLLEDAGGNLLRNSGFHDNYIGDVGDPAYQQAWAHNVLTILKMHHDDGVFIDDVLRDLVPLAGDEAAKYPTQQAWASAQASFIKTVGSALRAKGYYVLVNATGYIRGDPNSDNGTATIGWWRRLAPYVSGLLNEYYQESPTGDDALRPAGTSSWTQNWDGWQRLVQSAQSVGKGFVGLSYGPGGDLAQMMYGKASFLLDWNGGDGAYIYVPTDGSDPSNGIWATNIGTPLTPKCRVGSGWLRKYTAGIALVNPDPSNSQEIDLGGDYMTPDRSVVTSVKLPPVSGLILRSVAKSRSAR